MPREIGTNAYTGLPNGRPQKLGLRPGNLPPIGNNLVLHRWHNNKKMSTNHVSNIDGRPSCRSIGLADIEGLWQQNRTEPGYSSILRSSQFNRFR